MRRATSAEDLGVYVHVPFCERVCPYCDFAVEAVGSLAPALERSFAEGVARELELVMDELGAGLADRPLATLYIGGGTPSLLDPDSVRGLIETVCDRFAGAPQEVTLELNPGVVELARVPGFARAGVTRLSVGVQSLADETLRRLGRAHKGRDARRGLEACLEAGFQSVSADLIFGAPGQTREGALTDLEQLLDLGVPHISSYALTLEPDTPFGRAARAGQLRLPDEDEVLAMGRGIRARLAAAGYEQYEISSFARPGHRSRHNQRYWRRQDVLGLGPSAASLVAERRFQNAPARTDWAAALGRGRRALVEDEPVSAEGARRETLYLGLRRLDGVRRAEYLRRFGAAPERHFPAELTELRELELLEDRSGALCLTERGILFADEVFLRFVGR